MTMTSLNQMVALHTGIHWTTYRNSPQKFYENAIPEENVTSHFPALASNSITEAIVPLKVATVFAPADVT